MYLVANPPKLERPHVSCDVYPHSCWETLYVLNFIEDDTAGLIDSEQADTCSHYDQEAEQLPVRAGQTEYVMILHSLGCVACDFGGRQLRLPGFWCRRA
jgi:hypothetical protein